MVTDSNLPHYQAQAQEVVLFEHAFRRQLPVLLKGPTGCGKTRFVDLVLLMDMKIARVTALRRDRRDRIERTAAKEGDLDIFVEAMDAEEPAVCRLPGVPRAVQWRVPLDRS